MKCIWGFFILFVVFSVFFSLAYADGTIEDAFKDGTIKGTIGSYFEQIERSAANSDSGWQTTYLTLKYETLAWNNLKFGTRFFAHGELYSDHDNGTSDPFAGDIERKFTVPEFYLNYGFGETSSVTIGRWDHRKTSIRIDDAQSEGGYVSYKEIEDLDLIFGFMTRFAEIDYDDGEDFGRANETQDLSRNGTYGVGSADYMLFLDATCSKYDWLKLNPYIMYQDDYAAVYGLHAKLKSKLEDFDLVYGTKIDLYHVDADITGSGDANVYMIGPFIKKDNVKLNLRYAKYDDGNALNKPAWLEDEFDLIDQNFAEMNADATIYEAKLKFSFNKWWTHLACSISDYTLAGSEGDGSTVAELQYGYKFTKALDLNVRLYDVEFENANNVDYQKVEIRTRFKF